MHPSQSHPPGASTMSLTARLLVVMTACLLTVTSAGCAGGKAAPRIFSPDTVIGEMSDADFLHFCGESLSYMAEIGSRKTEDESECMAQGLYARFTGDGEVSTCEANYAACMDEASINGGSPSAEAITCGASELDTADTCTATISDYDFCTDAIDAIVEMIDVSMKCDATMEKAMELQSLRIAMSPVDSECTSIVQNCPFLAGALP